MAKAPKVWVRPKSRGQMPNGVWTDEGGSPFQVLEKAVSRAWQTPVPEAEANALDEAQAEARKASRAASKTVDASDFKELSASLEAITKERDDLKAELDALKAAKEQVKPVPAKPPEPTKPPSGPKPEAPKK